MISGGWLTWRQFKLACHPQGLYDEIRNIKDLDLKSLVLDMSHEEKALEGCSSDEKLAFVENHTRRERHWFKILSYLMDKDPTEVVSILFDGTDKIQHLCWPILAAWAEGSQEAPQGGPILAACLEYYGEIDRTLGWLMDRMEPDTHLLLVSDHGFGESRDIFFVNQWLHDNGLLHWKEDQIPEATDERHLGMARISRHAFEMDWDRTRAFAATPSSNGIHVLPLGNEDGRDSPTEEKKALVEEIIARLSEVQSPTTGKPMVERVWKREEAFPGPHGALAPDLTLSLRDGGLVSILASETPTRKRTEPVGVHRPEGIFVGVGPGFVEGRHTNAMSLLDVAPLALHLLGLPIPADLEGRAPEAVLKPDFRGISQEKLLERRPGEGPSGPTQDEEDVLTEEDEEAIAESLRRLGYLE
jgi:predicted AlkP superfamily phosphohydrolase/phosphomutase